MVGVYFSFKDKGTVVSNFQNDLYIPSVKLFSFEMKVRLDISNLRECYFQAVSNSSWANEGYLVTVKIGEGVIEEARILAASFGIGLIKLDLDNIQASQIIVPAALKKELDIDAMDRLANENPHFTDFLQNIIEDKQIKKAKSKYDEVLGDDDDAFEKYLKEKKIKERVMSYLLPKKQ